MTSGKPNDRMSLNTSEVSQIGFAKLQKSVWLIWSCPENVLSVRMSLGTSPKFKVAFSSHLKLLTTLRGPPVERSRTRRGRTSIRRRFLGRVCLHAKIFRRPFFNNVYNIRSW